MRSQPRASPTRGERTPRRLRHRIASVTSIYRRKGEVQRDYEQLQIIKTTRARFDALRDRIVALHPYELSEVIAIDIAAGLDRYLAWIAHATTHAD